MGFLKKKNCLAKSDEKIVCSADCKKYKGLSTKTGRKVELYASIRGGEVLVPLPERKTKFIVS